MNDCFITINRPEAYNSFMFFYHFAFIIPFLILIVNSIRNKYDMGKITS